MLREIGKSGACSKALLALLIEEIRVASSQVRIPADTEWKAGLQPASYNRLGSLKIDGSTLRRAA